MQDVGLLLGKIEVPAHILLSATLPLAPPPHNHHHLLFLINLNGRAAEIKFKCCGNVAEQYGTTTNGGSDLHPHSCSQLHVRFAHLAKQNSKQRVQMYAY